MDEKHCYINCSFCVKIVVKKCKEFNYDCEFCQLERFPLIFVFNHNIFSILDLKVLEQNMMQEMLIIVGEVHQNNKMKTWNLSIFLKMNDQLILQKFNVLDVPNLKYDKLNAITHGSATTEEIKEE